MQKISFLATDGMLLDGFLQKGKEKTDTILLAVHGIASNALKERDEVIARELACFIWGIETKQID